MIQKRWILRDLSSSFSARDVSHPASSYSSLRIISKFSTGERAHIFWTNSATCRRYNPRANAPLDNHDSDSESFYKELSNYKNPFHPRVCSTQPNREAYSSTHHTSCIRSPSLCYTLFSHSVFTRVIVSLTPSFKFTSNLSTSYPTSRKRNFYSDQRCFWLLT